MDLSEPGSDLGLSGGLQNHRSLREKATGWERTEGGAVRDSGDASCGPRRGELPAGGRGAPLLTLRLLDGFCCLNLGSVHRCQRATETEFVEEIDRSSFFFQSKEKHTAS